MKRIGWLCMLVCAGLAQAAEPSAPPGEAVLRARVDVNVDGRVARVVPDAALPAVAQQLLIRRVSEWRFKPTLWQGRAIATSDDWAIHVQLLPTTQGGHVLKVVDAIVANRKEDGYLIVPPRYPKSAPRSDVSAAFLYEMTQARDGRFRNVRMVWSAGEGSKPLWVRDFDLAVQSALADSRLPPITVDGVIIECRRILPMDFRMQGYEEPAQITADRRDALAAWRANAKDECPMPALETVVAGKIL